MFKFNFKSTKGPFFNSRVVFSAVEKATKRSFSKFGAYVRIAARRSIRKRKKTSLPGQPPSSHAGHLRNLIFFAYDTISQTVVIGPLLFREGNAELLERGGTRTTKKYNKKTRKIEMVKQHYAARPYMTPAFEAEQDQLPEILKNSVRK